MRLVTGGTGLLGSYLLCRLFLENKPARVLKRTDSSFFQLRLAFEFMKINERVEFEDFIKYFDWTDSDLRDISDLEECLSNVNEIFHLAALVSFNKHTNKDLPEVNLNGTRNLVNLALKLKIPAFHFVSSIASLRRNESGVMTEAFTEFNFNRSTPYSKSKYLSEMEVWRGYNEGLKGVIINPAIILGTGDITRGSLVFYNFIKKGLPVYPVGKNGFVDVRDVADCMYLLAQDSQHYNNRYLLVSGGCYYKDIFSLIANGLHLKPPSIKVSPAFTRFVYVLDSIRSKISFTHPIITRDILRLVNDVYEFDNSKVCNALNFKFRSMEESVTETTDFLLKSDFGQKFRSETNQNNYIRSKK